MSIDNRLDQLSDEFQLEIMNIMEHREQIDASVKKMIEIFQQVRELQQEQKLSQLFFPKGEVEP